MREPEKRLKTAQFEYVNSSTFGARMPRADWGFVGSIPFLLPPVDEQQAIVSVLDHRLDEVQRFVALRRGLIERLEEQRSVITTRHIAGQGINLERQASGLEWLPDVPAGWEQTRLKYVASIRTGVTLGKSYANIHTVTRPYLRVANVKDGHLDLTNIAEVSVPPRDAAVGELEPGDVLMTEGGDIDKLGRGCLWNGEIPNCLHQNHVFTVRTDRSRLLPEFLAALMTSHHGREYFTRTAKKTTNLASTNSSTLGRFPLFLPDTGEQARIIERLTAETRELAEAIRNAEREIGLIQEYRDAIITEAVTGQIDCRAPRRPAAVPPRPAPVTPAPAAALLDAEIVASLHAELTFGWVKRQKLFAVCHYHGRLRQIEARYRRMAAGPADLDLLDMARDQCQEQRWYREVCTGEARRYKPLENAGGHRAAFLALWPDEAPHIREVLKLLGRMDTQGCEMAATLYFAWNDLLLWGRDATDAAILDEVLERWHQRKRNVPRTHWKEKLTSLRSTSLRPTGFGRATTEPPGESLFE